MIMVTAMVMVNGTGLSRTNMACMITAQGAGTARRRVLACRLGVRVFPPRKSGSL